MSNYLLGLVKVRSQSLMSTYCQNTIVRLFRQTYTFTTDDQAFTFSTPVQKSGALGTLVVKLIRNGGVEP